MLEETYELKFVQIYVSYYTDDYLSHLEDLTKYCRNHLKDFEDSPYHSNVHLRVDSPQHLGDHVFFKLENWS